MDAHLAAAIFRKHDLFSIHSDGNRLPSITSLAKGLHGHGILVTMAIDVEVRPSRIEGLGIFAAHAFRAGERIRHINVLREVRPELPIREDLGELRSERPRTIRRNIILHHGSRRYRIGRRDYLGLQHQRCERNVLAVSVRCSSMSGSGRRRFLFSSKGMAARVSTAACRMVHQAAP